MKSLDLPDNTPLDSLSDCRKFEQFKKYHRTNPAIFNLFCQFANAATGKQRRTFGANMIMQRIRWYTTVEAGKSDLYKVNNNYAPYYARLFEIKYPQFKGLFAKRRVQKC